MTVAISYAQNREDVILYAFFPDVEKGFYVDVGANHPIEDSVTYLFFNHGWAGINIEPIKKMYSQLKQHRERDINLNVGVSNKKGTLKLREYTNSGLSTFSEVIKEDHAKKNSDKTKKYQEYEVKVLTLRDIFEQYKVEHIHFLKVDVEGYEYEVLEGNDWERYRPEVICIEANHIIHDWRPLLKKQGYKKVFFDGLNDYYVAHESHQRGENFSYPDQVLLGPPILHYSTYRELLNRDAQINKLEKNYKLATSENYRLYKHIEYINAELSQRKRVREQVKTLLRSLDTIIDNQINKLRRQRASKYNVIINLEPTSLSPKRLIWQIREMDFKTFYDLSNGNQVSYSTAIITYRFVKRIAKKILQLFNKFMKVMMVIK